MPSKNGVKLAIDFYGYDSLSFGVYNGRLDLLIGADKTTRWSWVRDCVALEKPTTWEDRGTVKRSLRNGNGAAGLPRDPAASLRQP
jgi:hypothetical protein